MTGKPMYDGSGQPLNQTALEAIGWHKAKAFMDNPPFDLVKLYTKAKNLKTSYFIFPKFRGIYSYEMMEDLTVIYGSAKGEQEILEMLAQDINREW